MKTYLQKTIAAKWDQSVNEVTKQSRNALRSLYNSDFSNILLYGIHSTDKSAYEKAYNDGYDKGYIDGYKDGRNDLKKDKDFKTRQENSVIKELNELPHILIENLNLPIQVEHSFRFHNIRTLRDIAALSPKELSNLRFIGKITYMDIVEMLSDYGIDKTAYINWLHRFEKK